MIRRRWLWALFIVGCIALSPLAAPQDPLRTDAANQLQPPNASHLLGTDLLGRDVLSRLLHGGQRTLMLALAAAFLAWLPGAVIGLGLSFAPSWVDQVGSALINALLAFPGLLLALVAAAVLGRGATTVMIATGFALLPLMARLSRAAALAALTSEHVLAARSLGANDLQIARWHVWATCAPILAGYGAVIFSYALLNSAALSFLGISGDLAAPDWGGMLYEGRLAFRTAPWLVFPPGIGLALLVAFVNWAAGAFDADQLPSQG